MRGTTTFRAVDGQVWAHGPDGRRIVHTCPAAGGIMLARFERVLDRAREQRAAMTRAAEPAILATTPA